jgi:hypothetical protein
MIEACQKIRKRNGNKYQKMGTQTKSNNYELILENRYKGDLNQIMVSESTKITSIFKVS